MRPLRCRAEYEGKRCRESEEHTCQHRWWNRSGNRKEWASEVKDEKNSE